MRGGSFDICEERKKKKVEIKRSCDGKVW